MAKTATKPKEVLGRITVRPEAAFLVSLVARLSGERMTDIASDAVEIVLKQRVRRCGLDPDELWKNRQK